MSTAKNSLSSFGVKVYAYKGRKSISDLIKELGIDRKTMWALMYDKDLKQKVAKHMGFDLEEEDV